MKEYHLKSHHNTQHVGRHCGKSTDKRAQEMRMTNEAASALKRWIDALEETSTEEQELPDSNSVTMQNQEI